MVASKYIRHNDTPTKSLIDVHMHSSLSTYIVVGATLHYPSVKERLLI